MSTPDMVSIVIPSRNERFLQKTILDVLAKAKGEIEVIAILDGYWPEAHELVEDKRVRYLHKGAPEGMRAGINSGVAIARGEYILKTDAHCMFAEGFDEVLKADCEDNWVVIPRRKRLDPENWTLTETHKPDIDYEYLSFPDNPSDWGGPGLNGRIWEARKKEREDILIDDNLSFQGSCWFMKRDYFYTLELMDVEHYGTFWNEAQEIGLKCLSIGGRVVTNKKTWYAHLHKGKKYGRGYFLTESSIVQGATHTKKWIKNEAWDKQKIPFHEIIERFMPLPGWPENWKEVLGYKEAKKMVEEWQAYDMSGQPVGEPIAASEHWVPTVFQSPAEALDAQRVILNRFDLDETMKGGIELPMGRAELAQLFGELGYLRGAEIGVERGHFSKILFEANPDLTLFCVDPWLAYKGYREHVSQDKLDGFYEETKERLAQYKSILVRKTSMEAVKEIEDGSLDFVYIDANHDFQNTTNDIAEWSKKVRKGGIIAGHDYTRNKKKDYKCHVKDVVQGWTYAHDIQLWFITRWDNSPSWFWIK